MPNAPANVEAQTALLLQGGGARAAFQVGVLKAVSEILGRPARIPFRILCGTSAGAINAAVLATHADRFADGVDRLEQLWSSISPADVYRTDVLGVARNTRRWLSAFLFGVLHAGRAASLFDVSPLRTLIERHVRLDAVRACVADGTLRAFAVTASGYASGQSCTFFEAPPGTPGWNRSQRIGIPATLDVDHLLASSAIPFAFPAVRLNREYFGDGSIRQTAPISPALHLGADRLLIIGTARLQQTPVQRVSATHYPSLAQIASHVLASIFFDMLSVDIERLRRINRTISLIEPQKAAQAGVGLRPIDVEVACPSQPFDDITAAHEQRLPATIRFLLRSIGAMRNGGTTLVSYLLFDRAYCRALIDLGYRETIARAEELGAFLLGAQGRAEREAA